MIYTQGKTEQCVAIMANRTIFCSAIKLVRDVNRPIGKHSVTLAYSSSSATLIGIALGETGSTAKKCSTVNV